MAEHSLGGTSALKARLAARADAKTLRRPSSQEKKDTEDSEDDRPLVPPSTDQTRLCTNAICAESFVRTKCVVPTAVLPAPGESTAPMLLSRADLRGSCRVSASTALAGANLEIATEPTAKPTSELTCPQLARTAKRGTGVNNIYNVGSMGSNSTCRSVQPPIKTLDAGSSRSGRPTPHTNNGTIPGKARNPLPLRERMMLRGTRRTGVLPGSFSEDEVAGLKQRSPSGVQSRSRSPSGSLSPLNFPMATSAHLPSGRDAHVTGESIPEQTSQMFTPTERRKKRRRGSSHNRLATRPSPASDEALLSEMNCKRRTASSRDAKSDECNSPLLPIAPRPRTFGAPQASAQLPIAASSKRKAQGRLSPESCMRAVASPQRTTESMRALVPTKPTSEVPSRHKLVKKEAPATAARSGTSRKRAKPTPSAQEARNDNVSIKKLKTLSARHGVDSNGCVEKTGLSSGTVTKKFAPSINNAEDLVEESSTSAPQTQTAPQPRTDALDRIGQDAADQRSRLRTQTAEEEVSRMLKLAKPKERYPSQARWAFAVLGLVREDAKDVSIVQHAYRGLMKKLHPDRVGHSPRVAQAIELLREAKQICERVLSQLKPPGLPLSLQSTMLCPTPGRRRVKLEWALPEASEAAPVRRYIVAAFDPAYGRELTITVLEPDYNEELGRFVPVEELGSYVLAEEDLQKMPSLFKRAYATLQVAAENEAGRSSWAKLRLQWPAPPADGAPTSAPLGMSGLESSSVPSRSGFAWRGSKTAAPHSRVAGKCKTDAGLAMSCKEFDKQLLAHKGRNFRAWLRKQNKGLLGGWLKMKSWPTDGSKDELIDRIAFVMDGNGSRGV